MSNPKPFRIGLVQMSCSLDARENQEKAEQKIIEAAQAGAQVICLPELYRTQYFCREEKAELFDLAEPVPGATTASLGKIAKEHRVVIVASLFERRAPGLYHNTAAILGSNGDLLGLYRKMHIPDDPLFFEKFYFTPGDLGFKNFDTEFGRLGVLVCWDQWYPEAARLTAMQGANILFYPTAIGWHPAEKAQYGPGQLDAWRTIQRSHAIANGLYVAAVNRVGYEGPRPQDPTDANEKSGLEFWGNSFLADPFGKLLVEGSNAHEEILVHEVNPAWSEEVRRNWPFFRDRRIDHYGGLSARWGV